MKLRGHRELTMGTDGQVAWLVCTDNGCESCGVKRVKVELELPDVVALRYLLESIEKRLTPAYLTPEPVEGRQSGT